MFTVIGMMFAVNNYMIRATRPKIESRIVFIVVYIAITCIALGTILSFWSSREMREVVDKQFNEEQLYVARSVKTLIERELRFLQKELLLLSENIAVMNSTPSFQHLEIQNEFNRVQESGVWKIESVNLENRITYSYTPHSPWKEIENIDVNITDPVQLKAASDHSVWVSRPQTNASEIHLIMAAPLIGDETELLIFHINISIFLAPFIKDIHSGKTGYAWIIDEKGYFLYHPDVSFIGKSAFTVRSEKHPDISFYTINFIQKEKMLKGDEGTGSYVSGWHRGNTGKINKLIAFTPISISNKPPQKWSVAVVAPVSEIEEALEEGHLWQLSLQGFVIIIILSAALSILFLERRWSGRLKEQIRIRTAELGRSEENYRSLVESAEDFIYTIDKNGIFQSANSFTAAFFGTSPKNLIGKSIFEAFSEESAKRQIDILQQVYNKNKSVHDELIFKINGKNIWINANFMPLKSKNGNITAVLCIARDITEIRNLERHLINAEKLASVGTLAAGVAHEINNPLGVILGFCDLLLRKKKPGSQEYEDLKIIERQGLHCKKIVENLLSFSRERDEHSAYCDMNRCLQEILRVVHHNLEINQIKLFTNFEKEIPPVNGDTHQLQQVFLNLINNAVASMPGGGSITISTYLDKARRKARVILRDTGSGVDPANLDHIFEPFYTTKPEGEGNGLGLFVSYGIVTKFGGTIECISQTRGVTFTVELPIKDCEE
ncbi:MAG: PAS domain S-box protein [Desulfobacterales bacterium]|nr:PAS domain S-box protein [Desulfobacterales bacterium]